MYEYLNRICHSFYFKCILFKFFVTVYIKIPEFCHSGTNFLNKIYTFYKKNKKFKLINREKNDVTTFIKLWTLTTLLLLVNKSNC